GIHDSNAALVAARGFTPFETSEATVLSTGTWFVAMRTPAQTPSSDQSDTLALPAGRDCLLNVDVDGNPVPSVRFMGGREIEILTGADARTIDIRPDQPALLQAAPRLVSERTFITPSFARGCGPFPQQPGEWIPCHPAAPIDRRAVAALYTALVADTALSLIGARERLL